jgi:hypothetical protein
MRDMGVSDADFASQRNFWRAGLCEWRSSGAWQRLTMDSLTTVAVVAGSIFVPSALAIGMLWAFRKWQDREGRRSPLENKRLHGAGEQLRKRIEDEGDALLHGLTVLFFIGPYFLAVWALPRVDWSRVHFGWVEGIFVLAFVAMAAWAVRMMIVHGAARRRAIAGLKAELFTAQELNRLMGMGCTVLHDVPADKFNLDHVVIGPRGVFLVETKSVRKPRKTEGQDHFKVAYDGECLRFPDFVSRKAVAQARHQAQWLATYLNGATNRSVPVFATISLPGWWIDSPRAINADAVRVFNPAGRGANFMAEGGGGNGLDTGLSGLITQALVMRYPPADK